MDPGTATTIYAGTQRLWRTTDGGTSWAVQSASADLTGGAPHTITKIAIAPSATATIMVTTSDGLVQRSTDSGVTFTNVTAAPLPGRFATTVAVHPTDPLIAFVGFSGFDDVAPAGHIFRTIDGGGTWDDISGVIPDTPVNAIAVRPDVPTEVYAGTDVGVFLSLDVGTTWTKMTTGLPNAPVIDIQTDVSTNVLAIGTHGRSVFTAQLSAQAAPTATPTSTPAATNTPTATPIPTATATNTPIGPAATATPTSTPTTVAQTSTATSTPVGAATATPTTTPTVVSVPAVDEQIPTLTSWGVWLMLLGLLLVGIRLLLRPKKT